MDKSEFLNKLANTLELVKKHFKSNDTILMALNNIKFKDVDNNIIKFSVSSEFTKRKLEKEVKVELVKIINNEFNDSYNVSFVNKKDEKNEEVTKEEKFVLPEKKESINTYNFDNNLNPKYQFETFIVDNDNNNFAYNACLNVAKQPGTLYNPLLIYGGVGLGKTHLIQSIGNEIKKSNKDLKALYVTAEMFIKDFVEYIGTKNSNKKYSNNDFYNKYRKADVLLIDDIHTLQTATATQEELFYTFNTLFEKNKQIVFTCDRPIQELTSITERLRNRFSRGLNVNLNPYKYETRLAILQSKVKERKNSVDVKVLDFIAKHVQTNIRDLESNLLSVFAYQDIYNKKVNLEEAIGLLSLTVADKKIDQLTLDDIMKKVSEYFSISSVDIKGNSKKKVIKNARNCFIFIAKEYTEETLTEIGTYLGGRSHSTVHYVYSDMQSKIEINEDIKNDINLIKKSLNITY